MQCCNGGSMTGTPPFGGPPPPRGGGPEGQLSEVLPDFFGKIPSKMTPFFGFPGYPPWSRENGPPFWPF